MQQPGYEESEVVGAVIDAIIAGLMSRNLLESITIPSHFIRELVKWENIETNRQDITIERRREDNRAVTHHYISFSTADILFIAKT